MSYPSYLKSKSATIPVFTQNVLTEFFFHLFDTKVMKDILKIKRSIWTAGIPISSFHLSILNAPLQAFLRSLLFDRRKIAIVQEISTTNLIFHSCQTFECHLFVPGSLPQIYLPLFEQNSKDPKTLCQQERQRFDLGRNILLYRFEACSVGMRWNIFY